MAYVDSWHETTLYLQSVADLIRKAMAGFIDKSPPTDKTLEDLGRNDIKRVLVVPISFVSDHIETLQEIAVLYKNLAAAFGIAEFRRAASLNLCPRFIEALTDIVMRSFGS